MPATESYTNQTPAEDIKTYNSLLNELGNIRYVLSDYYVISGLPFCSPSPSNCRTDLSLLRLRDYINSGKIPVDVCTEFTILLRNTAMHYDKQFKENHDNKELVKEYKKRNNRLWTAVAILAALSITSIIAIIMAIWGKIL